MLDNDLVQLGELLAHFAVAVVEERQWALFATLQKAGGRKRGTWTAVAGAAVHTSTPATPGVVGVYPDRITYGCPAYKRSEHLVARCNEELTLLA